jgi:hypothetical protein
MQSAETNKRSRLAATFLYGERGILYGLTASETAKLSSRSLCSDAPSSSGSHPFFSKLKSRLVATFLYGERGILYGLTASETAKLSSRSLCSDALFFGFSSL